MRDILIYFAHKHAGNWTKIYNSLDTKEEIDLKQLNHIKSSDLKTITILDPEYPKELKSIRKPPFVLFIKGNKKLLQKEVTDVLWPTGSYVDENTINEINELNKEFSYFGMTMVTGITDEFESQLINQYKGYHDVIIVKDSGIESTLLLDENIQRKITQNLGIIISEYPGHVKPSVKSWEDSNRIKIGLSSGLFLVNSFKEETMFSIIRESLEENKEVYAYTKNAEVNKNKCNNMVLIKNGAYEVRSLKDISKVKTQSKGRE